MKRIFVTASLILIGQYSNAQSSIERIFNNSVHKIKSSKNVSYRTQFIDKNPFSEGDTSKGEAETIILLNPDGTVKYKYKHTKVNEGQTEYRTIYAAKEEVNLDLKDSTFSTSTPKAAISYELADFAEQLSRLLKKPSQIRQLNDTLYEKRSCYHFLVKTFDTLINGKRDFTNYELLIDRKTAMPALYRHAGAGNAFKEGIAVGRLVFFNETRYSDIRLAKGVVPISPDLKGFTARPTEMLKVGTKAPALSLRTLAGEAVPTRALDGKLLLLVFGDVGCPANPLANPMLNRLHAKYATQAFNIANVYTVETEMQARQYIVANGLQFPIYLGNSKMKHAFQTLGTPNFYLINSEGKIVLASNGYSTKLEAELTKNINQLLGLTE
jgi:peroxiredoxin